MALTRPRALQIFDLDYKQAVRAITTSNITLSGGAPNTVDGVTLVAGDRILVNGQGTASQNGIYEVQTLGTGVNGTWVRTVDASTTGTLLAGSIVMVTEGTVYADTQWKLVSDNPIVIGTTPLTWEQNSAFAFGNIYANGTAVLANTVGDTLTLSNGNNIVITGNATAKSVTIAVTESPSFTGTLNVTGNANVGNLGTAGQVSATGNVTGGNLNTGGQVVADGNVSGGNISAAAAISAGTTVTATGNVTGGNLITTGLTSTNTLSASGNANVGNLGTAGEVVATGNVSGGNVTTAGQVVATGNVSGGNLVTTGAVDAATVTATGNVSGGNVTTAGSVDAGAITSSTTITATGNITGGNVTTAGSIDAATITATGNVSGGNLVTAGTVDAGAITSSTTITATGNITGGNLNTTGLTNSGSLTVTGNADVGNLSSAGEIVATGNITGGNLITAGEAFSGTLRTVGDALINGNLTVQGNLKYINVEDLRVEDPVIIMGTGPNGAPLTSNDGLDRGIYMEYYTTGLGNAFVGWQNSTGNMIIASDVDFVSNDVIQVNSYGTLQAGNAYLESAVVIGNIAAGNISTSGTLETSGNLSANNLSATNSITAGTTITATGNVTGGNITTAGLVNSSTLNVTANANVGNLGTTGEVSATGNITGGNLVTGGSVDAGAITSSTTIAATGNVSGGNLVTTGVTDTGSVNAASTITAAGNITGGNITTAGLVNSSTLNVTANANVGNLGTTGEIVATGNITGGNVVTAGTVDAGAVTSSTTIAATGNVSGGNLTTVGTTSTNILTASGNADVGNLNTAGGVSATGNITGGNVVTAGTVDAGSINSSTTVTATGNVSGGNVTTAGSVDAGAITSSTTITATGNVSGGNLLTVGNITATGNIAGDYFIGNGRFLSGIDTTLISNGSTEVRTYENGNVAFTVAGTSNVVIVTNDSLIVTGNISATDQITATGNVSGGNLVTAGAVDAGSATVVGNIVSGNTVVLGLTDTNTLSVTGNANVGNLGTTGAIVATGNITGGNLITSGAIESAALSVTGNVDAGNLNTVGQVTATGNITGGNVTATNLTGTLLTANQPNITDVGTLNNLTVAGNTVSGTGTFGNITISGSNINSDASRITVNSDSSDVDFAVDGDTNANVFYVDAGTETVSIGNSTQTTGATLSINSTDSVLMPRGTDAERPDPAAIGMTRYNTDEDKLEVYTSTGWEPVGSQQFTVIDSETFNGDGSTVAFTLSTAQTTNSCIVSINGVVQEPVTAYSVSGTTLTFTEAPLVGDTIEVRTLTTTTTVTGLANSAGNAKVVVTESSSNVVITGDLIPNANITQNLGANTARWNELYLAGNTIVLGDVVIKNTGGNTIGFFGPDGTTPGSIDTNNIDSAGISNGTSSLTVIASDGNIRANVGGNTVGLFSTTGLSITGDLSVTGNATLTGNILGDRIQNGTTQIDIQTQNGNANITVGGVSNVAVFTQTGLVVTGSIEATNGFIGLDATSIANGTANVRTFENANVTVSAGGNANVVVVTGTGAEFTRVTTPAITKSGSNGVGNIGQSDNTFNTIFARATSALYADLAEQYLADSEYGAGTVLVFGGAAEVTESNSDADHRVAGVVSTNPAYIMNAGLTGTYVTMVALTGRVPCRVRGPVRKGDLMVSTGNGHAQADNSARAGTIIGKALEDFSGESGVIEVVVGRY